MNPGDNRSRPIGDIAASDFQREPRRSEPQLPIHRIPNVTRREVRQF
jgi:hypothetical protein